MANQYTDQDWSKIISQTIEKVSLPKIIQYSNPKPGTYDFSKTIDHTLLKLDATTGQIDSLCAEAKADDFATVCVRPNFVRQCTDNLSGSGVGVACVIGFHEGTYDLAHKTAETKIALEGAANELDLVINYPELKQGQYAKIFHELATLRAQAPPPVLIKLIIETSQLDRDEVVAACVLAAYADMDFVKTSTGFNGPGASVENVRLMKAVSETLRGKETGTREMLVKASGGIRSLADAIKMLEAGASRLGTSGGVTIAREGREHGSGGNVASSQDASNVNSATDY